MIKSCFGDSFIYINIDKLEPSKSLIENVKKSHKYHQILSSIEAIGIIEPVVVFYDESQDKIKILDGHLRLEALKELNINNVPCLISSVNDAYTPNKQVNHINVIEEHRMIIKALSKVSAEKLSAALGISVQSVKDKANALNGIDSSVISKLSDKQVPRATFNVLKKMKPIRQIEAAGTMIHFDNYGKNFAINLLNSTHPSLLISKNKSSKYHKDIRRTILRLEQEMATTREETNRIKAEYGANMLKFVIIQSYITKLLNNTKVLHWLLENETNYLNELKKLTQIVSIENEIISKK